MQEVRTDRSREDRIREYAWIWYEYRILNKRPGDALRDWLKAEHIVDSEDAVIERLK